MNGKLPDFIVCGLQKCGTQSLRVNLNKHSQINIPRAVPGNEFNFFRLGSSQNTFNKGFDWYTSFFTDREKIHGDVSPNYAFEPDVNAKTIKKYVPNSKLIFSVRNPIDRAYSAFNHYLQVYPESKNWGKWYPTKSFVENCRLCADFTKINYQYIISEYLKYFDKENIHIIFQENLKKLPQQEFKKIFKFLNVKEEKITSQIIHSRTKIKLKESDRNEVIEYFDKIVMDFYNIVGNDIFIWEDWND